MMRRLHPISSSSLSISSLKSSSKSLHLLTSSSCVLSSKRQRTSTSRNNHAWSTTENERNYAHKSQLRRQEKQLDNVAFLQQQTSSKNTTQLRTKMRRQQTIAEFLSCLEQGDPPCVTSNFVENNNGTSDSNKDQQHSIMSSTAAPSARFVGSGGDSGFGPPSTDEVLPWLSLPGPKKTYINSLEVSSGRKEMWSKVITETDRKRQLVENMWTYICDAEAQAEAVEGTALNYFQNAKQTSEEFKLWIQRMDDDKDGVMAFFEWADPTALSGSERREIQKQQQQSITALSNNSNNNNEADPNQESSLSTQDRQQLDAKLLFGLKSKDKKRAALEGLSKREYREMKEDISVNTPLAPYEDLPFLKMRMQEDPSSLDPSLKDWAQKNLDLLDKYDEPPTKDDQEDASVTAADGEDTAGDDSVSINGGSSKTLLAETGEGDDDLHNEVDHQDTTTVTPATVAAQAKSVSSKLTPEETSAKRAARLARKAEISSRVYLKTKSRVNMSKLTYDDEGVYFHVVPKETTSLSSSSSSIKEEESTSNNNEDHTPIDRLVEDRKYSSMTKRSMSQKHFAPKMVRAYDDTSKGVVKIDWPTVRAAFGGKRRTDISREDQAAARERVIRLCRGEDPNTL